MKKLLHTINVYLPWTVIGLVFAWSAIVIALRHHQGDDPRIITLRIGHWQLEPGVREGLTEAAAAYTKLHPNVRIVQEAIPEGTYPQWMSTQLMGGTAPDILEAGLVTESMMNAFFVRDFVPLTPYITKPNPYNAGTPLADLPLFKTYKDALGSSYVPELEQYMTLPLALISIRVFYNKTLLKKLTGLDSAPTEYRAFIAACEKIRSQKQPNGSPYIAIAGSPFYFTSLDANMVQPLTYNALRKADFNHDGRLGADEMFMAFAMGRLSFDDPAYRGAFQMVRELTDQMPAGWSGLSRDEALFNFAQGKAVFAPTGVYEAAAMEDVARGSFDLGIIDFPVPSKSDPVYGPISQGIRLEGTNGGMPMGVTRASRHPEIAVDFLLFLGSLKENEAFNARLKWVPITVDAKSDPLVKVFDPTLVGPTPAFNPNLYAETSIKWNQLYQLYQIHQIDYAELVKRFTQFYLTQGWEDFKDVLRDRKRQQIQDQQEAVGWRQLAMSSAGEESTKFWNEYRSVVVGQQMQGDQMLADDGRLLTNRNRLEKEPLYQFTPQALENVRRGLQTPTAENKKP